MQKKTRKKKKEIPSVLPKGEVLELLLWPPHRGFDKMRGQHLSGKVRLSLLNKDKTASEFT